PVMEKTAEDWSLEVAKLSRTEAAAANYLIEGRAPRAGEVFRQKNLARTLRALAAGGRGSFYRGGISPAMADYFHPNGGRLTTQDLSEQHSAVGKPDTNPHKRYNLY